MKSPVCFRLLTSSVGLCLAGLLAACGSGHTATPTGAIPAASTTLKAETSNNTSAAASFTGQTNGNTPAANVSKLPIAPELYGGAKTPIYVTWLGWFGLANHITVGYNSDTQAQVHAQVQDMISRGIAGAISDWYGTSNTFIDDATMLLKSEAEASGGKFQFAIMEDKGALGAASRSNHCDVTDQLISDLNYFASTYESSPAYVKVNGRPLIYAFDINQLYIDWNRVMSSVPSNPLIIMRGPNAFTEAGSDGGYSWVAIKQNMPFNPELNVQDAFFQAAQKTSGKYVVGTAFKGFNDTLATWGTNRVVDQNCGQTWIQSLQENGKFYSSGNQLPALQIATWNDYEEGTAIEMGVDNCVYLVPSQSGSTVQWTVNGNENTIDHYTIFISTDGVNLSSLIDVPNGTHSVDLSKLTLNANTTYFVYVKAVGLPSIQNKMSPAIGYRQADTPPGLTLNASQGSGLTYTASTSTSGSSAVKTTIDFGDGTVANGTTATHIYKTVGSYLITATAFDSAGASSVAVQQISAKSPQSGVSIYAPAGGSTVNWPTNVVASANASSTVAAMQILVDGNIAYAKHGDTVNTDIKVFTGNHQVTVQSLDSSSNTLGSVSFNVTAEPNDAPPVADLTTTALPNAGANTVLVCTTNSSDPDGFVNARTVKLSNGATFQGPSAVETFAAPGTYSATITVTDEFGATDTKTFSFSVP